MFKSKVPELITLFCKGGESNICVRWADIVAIEYQQNARELKIHLSSKDTFMFSDCDRSEYEKVTDRWADYENQRK